MHPSRFVRLAACVALAAASIPALRASALETKTTPALSAFASAWDKITSYTETIVTHEVTNDGKSSQDRTYGYKFLKPTYAVIDIEDGPGKGGGAAWHGGDRVKGPQGGLFSGVKLMRERHRCAAIRSTSHPSLTNSITFNRRRERSRRVPAPRSVATPPRR
jgi:hypothetical protein